MPSASASAVSMARWRVEATTASNAPSASAARRASFRPSSVSGGSAWPCHRPVAFHSDCPCRMSRTFRGIAGTVEQSPSAEMASSASGWRARLLPSGAVGGLPGQVPWPTWLFCASSLRHERPLVLRRLSWMAPRWATFLQLRRRCSGQTSTRWLKTRRSGSTGSRPTSLLAWGPTTRLRFCPRSPEDAGERRR